MNIINAKTDCITTFSSAKGMAHYRLQQCCFSQHYVVFVARTRHQEEIPIWILMATFRSVLIGVEPENSLSPSVGLRVGFQRFLAVSVNL